MKDLQQNLQSYLVTGLLVVAAFVIGMLFTEVRYLKQGVSLGANGGNQAPAAAAPAAPEAAFDPKNVEKVSDREYIRGNKNAKVSIIEYSDFECPFCARFHPTMTQIMKDYEGKVKWVYRHYPLTSIHPQAQKAAEASECVAKQKGGDGFWQFADAIFEENNKNAGRITAESITTSAQAVAGLNMSAFQQCLDSGEMAKKVTDQMTAGSKAGIQATPGSIVLTEDGKGEIISGAYPIEQVKAILDKYVK